MGHRTKIEWCDATWNPVDGCTPVSEGCKHCYAASIAQRFWPSSQEVPIGRRECYDESIPVTRPRRFDDVLFHPGRLPQPLHWTKPKRIFVCSMGDLFHEKVEDATINNVLSTMAVVDWHWYLVLTKRAARMQATLQASHLARWLPHVGFGVSVECQSRGDERVPLLLDTPAALRFISCEPLLGPVDLRPWLEQIDWVIAGGETGPMARKTKEEWVRSLRDQCNLAGKPFFFKQWATRPREPKQHLIDGQEWRQLPAALLVSPACASATG